MKNYLRKRQLVASYRQVKKPVNKGFHADIVSICKLPAS